MALAQQTEILFLDEPTTYLDMAHQLEVLKLLQQLNEEQGRTIVMVVHDLNHATRYAHHMVAIKSGKIVAEGEPAKVTTKEVLREVFGIEADILFDPRTGVPLCLPFELFRESLRTAKNREHQQVKSKQEDRAYGKQANAVTNG